MFSHTPQPLPTDETFKELFQKEASRISEPLRTLYLQELQTILSDTKARIARLLKIQEVSVENEVRWDVDKWLKMGPERLAYARYCQYVEKYFSDEKKQPCSFKDFSSKELTSTEATIYKRWRDIEEKNLIPGSKVLYNGRTFVIRGITKECRIILEGRSGSISPLNVFPY